MGRREFTWLASVAAVGTLLMATRGVGAHIEVTYPPTRYQFEPPNSDNQKIGPCATGVPTGTVTALQAGQELTVTWDEFINHPGHFRVALDTTGSDAWGGAPRSVPLCSITGDPGPLIT